MIVHRVENGSYFNKESLLERTCIQDIFLHHDCFLISLEKDEKVGSEQFVVKVIRIRNELSLFDIPLLEQGFWVDCGAVHSGY